MSAPSRRPCTALAFLVALSLAPWAAVHAAEVVVYTSLDQVFSEPVLQRFERESGIRVRAVYDVEASKTTGLVNRLIAEKDHPQADVFWNSEVGRTLVLAGKGVLAPYHSPSARGIPQRFKDREGYWTGFAARARVLICNTRLVSPSDAPASIFDLVRPRWRGKVALAFPLFGTTATQVAAWYAVLGPRRTEAYLRALRDNHVLIVEGNSTSRDVVARGEVPLGFTDTDDANLAIRRGDPVRMIFPDEGGLGTLLIPNTVALVDSGPHPREGKRLIDFLLSPAVEEQLAASGSMQIPLRDGVPTPSRVPAYSSIHAMNVDYQAIADNLPRATRFVRDLFLR